jgi:hypothetical protein
MLRAMHRLRNLLEYLRAERIGWFGAGLSAAAVGVVGYQLVAASLLAGALPGPQPADGGPSPSRVLLPFPTPTAYPTRTPLPTRTPFPTPTPRPTRTPFPSPTPSPTRTPSPTPSPWPTRTPSPTPTPRPTRTPSPTPTDPAADLLGGLLLGDPDAVVAAVATFAARTNAALEPLAATPTRR